MSTESGYPNNGDTAPMTADRFTAYMARRLPVESGQIEVTEYEGLDVKLRVRGAAMTANLARFYAAYRKNPSQLDAVVGTLVHVLLGEMPATVEGDYARLKEQIYPMLKPIELLVTVRERNLPMLVYREFPGGLIVTYVIDETHTVRYINEQHLEHWQVSVIDLHRQALENLRRRTMEQTRYTATGTGERRIFVFDSRDGYDATRLLLTDVLTGWAAETPGNLVIGVPNRDFLIAFSDGDGEVLRGVAAQIQIDAIEHDHGLTDQLFVLKDGQIEVYEWE